MSNRLEQYIKDHREEFDSEEPSPAIWEKIQYPSKPFVEGKARVIRLGAIRWAVAAAIILIAGTGLWIATRPKTNNLPEVAASKPEASDSQVKQNPVISADTTKQQLAVQQQPESPNVSKKNEEDGNADSESLIREEMNHYASLVELKHKQLKSIEKDEPLLYKQFAADVYKLDSVYNGLKKQLPKNPNREQLLEAMIQNLQLQMGLLNHQLQIIKQINHSKKAAYEKAYKSI
jgi:hypothetical protein